jgi:hypothetical protein
MLLLLPAPAAETEAHPAWIVFDHEVFDQVLPGAERGVRSTESSVSMPAASPAKNRVPSWSNATQFTGTSDTCGRIHPKDQSLQCLDNMHHISHRAVLRL